MLAENKTLDKKINKYVILLPVWGLKYIKIFIEVVSQTLLWNDNLPALAMHLPVDFVIICQENEKAYFDNNFRKRFQNFNINIIILGQKDNLNYDSSYSKFTAYYEAGLCHSNQFDDTPGFIFLTPDGIYGNGSFGELRRLVDSGYEAVVIPGPRINLRKFLVNEYVKNDKLRNPLSNRELVNLFFVHMHDISKSYIVNSTAPKLDEIDYINIHPAHAYWMVDNEVMLMRCFVTHPLFIIPSFPVHRIEQTLDYNLIPSVISDKSKIYYVEDSDEIFGVDLGESNYTQDSIFSLPKFLRKYLIIYIGKWWISRGWVNDYHLHQVEKIYCIHSEYYNRSNDLWVKFEEASNLFIKKMITTQNTQEVKLAHKKLFVFVVKKIIIKIFRILRVRTVK